jgi:hypothetical protein
MFFGKTRLAPRFAARRPVAWLVLPFCFLAAGAQGPAAESLLFTLEIPDGRSVTYELPLAVRHPGRLTIRAEWDVARQLSLRVDRPDRPVAVARRSGLSPQVLEIEIAAEAAGPRDWKLAIHAVAARGEGAGLLTIELPSAPGSASNTASPPAAEPSSPRPEPDPWMDKRHAPPGSPRDWVRLFEAGERYRALLAGSNAEPRPDSCRWQQDLMRYLAERLDDLSEKGAAPAQPTRRMLARIVDAVDAVESLRSSSDPLLAGPPPADRDRRELWLRLRREEIQPVESELDELAEQLQRGHAPELEDQTWTLRMVTCLTACERHFEARARVGEEQATNRDLALDQWDRLLAAADALRALAELGRSG